MKTFTASRFFVSADGLRIAQDEGKGMHCFFHLVTYDKAGEPDGSLIYQADGVLGWYDLEPQIRKRPGPGFRGRARNPTFAAWARPAKIGLR